MLSGKYLDGAKPEGSRLVLFERFKRYTNPSAEAATLRQLQSDIASAEIKLGDAVIQAVEEVFQRYPVPAP